jgi:transmembrane sensor
MNQIIITNNNIDEIIAKEIEGSASHEELTALNSWVNLSEDNGSYYRQMHEVNNFFDGKSLGKVDTDSAWSKVSARILDNESDQVPSLQAKSWSMLKYLGYAAAVAVLIFATTIIWQKPDNHQIYAADDTEINHSLADGSSVVMKKNSALRLLESSKREYMFVGQAKFKVTHSDKVPFVLHIDDIRVKDLGTVFDVEALPGNDTVQVKVSEGSVQFYTIDNVGMTLKAGEEAIYIKSKNKFLKRAIDVTKQFLTTSFQNATLGDVIDQLSYAFRKNVELENQSIKNCSITVDFSDAEYTLVKDILQETLDVNLVEKDGTIIIKGEGCQ